NQLHFSDTNNQRVYIAVSYVNNNPGPNCLAATRNPGYILYDATTNSVIEAVSNVASPSFDFHGRGVDTLNGCTVFSSTSGNNNGTYRTINGVSQQFMAGNARYLTIFDPFPGYPTAFPGAPTSGSALGLITSGGTSQGFFHGGLYSFDPVGSGCPFPCSSINKVFATTGDNPLGFYVADSHTVYLGECFNPFNGGNAASTGMYKFSYQSPCAGGTAAWTNVGRLDAIANETVPGQIMDVVGTVNAGNATLYAVGGGEGVGGTTIYKIGPDPLVNACPTSTWKTTATTTVVTGLSNARSIGIVPNTIIPPNRNLTTAVIAGSGSVSPAGTTSYPQCTNVLVTATPNANNAFLQWSNGATGSHNPNLQVQMDGNKTINAAFADTTANWILTINISGRGSVKSTPPGLTYTYPTIDVQNIAIAKPGPTSVSLEATPVAVTDGAPSQTGFVFDHWTGPVANPNNANTTVSVGADTTITAVFLPIYRVRTFVTGNGKVAITAPPNDGKDGGFSPYPYYRQGRQLTLQGTASGNTGATAVFCPNVPPVQPWSFLDWQDNLANSLSGSNPYLTAAIVAPTDFTGRFVETPANATPRAFTPGNIVVGQIRDATSNDQQMVLREYTPGGQLVQPVIPIPDTGTPSGSAPNYTSGVGAQMAFDLVNANWLYTAVNQVDGGINTGFIRTQFNGTAWTSDLSHGAFEFGAEGRGVVGLGAHIYYTMDGGLRDYNRLTGVDSLVTSDCMFTDNGRMLRVFNNKLYISTAGTSGDFTGGPGIYRVDFPGGQPLNPGSCSPPNSGTKATFTQIIPFAGASPLDFCFANANTLYVGFNSGTSGAVPFRNIHKFTFNGSSWDDASFGIPEGIASMSSQWVSAIDLTVAGNNDDVAVYFMATGDPLTPCESPATIGPGPTNSYVYRVDDKLISSPPDWYSLDPTQPYNASTNRIAVVVPMVTRGRTLQIVRTPACATRLGDTSGNNVVNGLDIQSYIRCFILAAGGAPTAGCACADVQSSNILDTSNLNAFVNLLLQ
ncbi:MAG TPA: hypothetical protein VMV81_11140, partial [Phycisphaerae bacterium]|nr:hypothetical protein [Phycisphaerae bacterium]